MMRLPAILLASIVLAFSAAAIPTDADGAPKRQTTKQKLAICDQNFVTCSRGCELLIDIGTAVAVCHSSCDRKFRRCVKRAQTFEVLPGTNSLTSDQPDINPGTPSGDDAGDDTAPPPYLY